MCPQSGLDDWVEGPTQTWSADVKRCRTGRDQIWWWPISSSLQRRRFWEWALAIRDDSISSLPDLQKAAEPSESHVVPPTGLALIPLITSDVEQFITGQSQAAAPAHLALTSDRPLLIEHLRGIIEP